MRITATLSAAVLCLLFVTTATAGDCCEKETCGKACHEGYCRVVRGTKEVKKTVWVVECEPFCVPYPGCGRHRSRSCGQDCRDDGCCDTGCCKKRCLVPPKCGPIRYRKKLVKKEIKCQVPIYKCVPVACGCCSEDGCAEPAADAGKARQALGPAPFPRW